MVRDNIATNVVDEKNLTAVTWGDAIYHTIIPS